MCLEYSTLKLKSTRTRSLFFWRLHRDNSVVSAQLKFHWGVLSRSPFHLGLGISEDISAS